MAFRLVYQISCNVNKPTFLGNSSAECLRCFRSLSPVFKPIQKNASTTSPSLWEITRRRSQSYPAQEPRRAKSFFFAQRERPISAERSVYTDRRADEEASEEQSPDDDFRHNPGTLPRARRREKSPPKPLPKRPKSLSEYPAAKRRSSSRPKPQSANKVRDEANTQLREYYLKDCTPDEKKRNVYEVFDYYSEQYKSKDTRVLPHLQPNNLKPYGTGENLIFPVNTGNKNRVIKYPIMEPGYTEQVAKEQQKKGRGSNVAGSSSSSRDYSTTSPSDEQLKRCNQILAEYKKANPNYAPPSKNAKSTQRSVQEKSFLEKTMKLISDFKGQQEATPSAPVENLKPSRTLEKCKQTISEFKKLNPNYRPPKSALKSGSPEEKEAINKALSFVAKYKNYYSQKNFGKLDKQDSTLSLRKKAVSEMQVRKQHRDCIELPAGQPQPAETKETTQKVSLVDFLNRSSSQPSVERKKYSFGDTVLNLPEVPVTPMTVRVSAKANLLQSSAPPEATKLWDKIQLRKNERLVSPWPSYAEHLKLQSLPRSNPRKIIYPPMPDDSKAMKNSTNLEIKSGNVQPKAEFSSRSWHDNVKFVSPKEAPSRNHEPSKKKHFLHRRSIETSRQSLPDLRQCSNVDVRHFSTSSKGTVCNEETVTPKRSKPKADKDPFCDPADLESPPETGQYFTTDCGCVTPKPPLDVPPLKRLKKRAEPKEPPKVCPPKEVCPPRADAGLKIQPKKLRKIVPPENCPCQDFEMQEGCPLPRLKKKPVKEPEKVCPCVGMECDCPPRADAGLKVKKKRLPKICPPEHCPCTPREMEDVPPLKPLKKVKIPEPPKVCRKECECCIPRADETLQVKKKSLPKLKASSCPCVKEKYPEDVPPLKRLEKVEVCEPKHVCTSVHPCEEAERADDICGYKVKPKTLPPMLLKAEHNHISVRGYGKKSKMKPGPKVNASHKRKFSIYSKLNNAWKVRKILSALNLHLMTANCYSNKSRENERNPDCCCVEEELPKEDITPKLKRLPKFKKEDIDWSKKCTKPCPNPRADGNWQSKKKNLPKLKPSKCPCVEKEQPDENQPQLKRLPKFKKSDVDWAEIRRCRKPCRNPRADDNWKSQKKRLPNLKASDCPCVDPQATLVDVAPMKRLIKQELPDVDWKKVKKCIVKCITAPRADETLVERERNLPQLKPSKCPCIEAKPPDEIDQPKLKRLPKFKKSDVDWKALLACQKPCKPERADAKLKPEKKALPKLKKGDCPCVDPSASLVDVEPLKRLPRYKKSDVNWKEVLTCNPPCPKAPRADWSLKPKSKSLPKLTPSKCPGIEKEAPSDNQPTLKRLPKFKKEDIVWKIKPDPCKIATRADDSWKMEKKSLPKIKSSDCPCVDPAANLEDVEPLKRLPKFKKEDINWNTAVKCVTPCRNPRADDKLKQPDKKLPRLKLNKCPCIEEPKMPAEKQPSLKRLPKFKKSDIDWAEKCRKPCLAPRADANLKDKKRPLPKLKSGDCPCVDESDKIQDVAPLKRLPKVKVEDVDWEKIKQCARGCPIKRADDYLVPKSKSLPQLKSSPCPCIDNQPPQTDAPKLKRLSKLKDVQDIVRVPKCIPKCTERSDELLGYKVKQKKLPPLLPAVNKKCYHTSRRWSYPIYKDFSNIINIHARMLNTTSRLYNKKQEGKGVSDKRECRKLEGKPGKKVCPKVNPLPGCKPKVRQSCYEDYVFKECTKQKTPYPSFSECGEIADFPTCECPEPDLRFLQPKYPIIRGPKIQAPPPPEHAFIDPQKEKECVLKKLGMKDEGETRTCSDFDKPPKEFKGKEMLAQAECEAEQKANEEGTSLEEMRDKAKAEACCQDKSKPGRKSTKECPVVYTETCCVGEPELQGPEKKEKSSGMICGPAKSDKKSDECKPASKSASKGKAKSKPAAKGKSKAKPKAAAKSKSKAASKSSSMSCTPAVIKKDKPMSLWEKIMSLFRSKKAPPAAALDPCGKSSKPKPKECSPQKPTTSKFKECPKVPKAPCGDKKSEETPKKAKAPTKKGATKVKKKPEPKKAKKAEPKKAKKAEPKEKKGKEEKKSLTDKEKKAAKKSKSKESTKSTKEAKPAKKPKASDKKKPDKKAKSAEKAKPAKKSKSAEKSKPDKKKPAKKSKSEDIFKEASKPKVECKPKKEDPCKPKKKDPCKPEKEDPCKPKPKDDNSKFANMFPPEMPDCRQRTRIRRSPPPNACLPPSIPMEECRRSLKECTVEIVECEPPPPPPPPLPETPKKESACGPPKPPKDPCKPADCTPKKPEKKPQKKSSGPKKSGKCKDIKLDNCPPRARDSCEESYIFKPCKAQESPYPSFSECRPPFPKVKRNECVVARENARATLSKINMNVNKKSKEDKCKDQKKQKNDKKGKRCYSTMSAVARTRAFFAPTQWRRHYSSSANGRSPKYSWHLLNNIERKLVQDNENGNHVLSQRLLASIEEGIEKLESQEADLPNNPYYQILKALQKLSEKEIYDFFDQEPMFNPFDPLKSDVRETVSFVCKLNPRADQNSLNSDVNFQPRCVGISDPNARREEVKIIEAFRNLCSRICEDPDISETPYEELERIKTENMQRELDNLLRRTSSEQ